MARSTEDTSNPLRRIFEYSQIGERICRCEYFVGAKKAELACFVTFFTLSQLESWLAIGSQGGIIDLCWGGGVAGTAI